MIHHFGTGSRQRAAGAQARSDSINPADVLWDCLPDDPSAWPGHPLDTHWSHGVTS